MRRRAREAHAGRPPVESEQQRWSHVTCPVGPWGGSV